MCRLIESICLRDGVFQNLGLHQQRVNRAFSSLFGGNKPLQLDQVLNREQCPTQGLYKCRVVYDRHSLKIELQPYTMPIIRSLKLVNADHIDYPHKFEDRTAIQKLLEARGTADDILMVKKGMITDSSYANVLFREGKSWLTPSTSLLRGTMREGLLKAGKVQEVDIHVSQLKNFESFRLINAMVGFDLEEQDILNIF